jgi:hypothetical protein
MTATTYSQIYERMVREDLEQRAMKREQRKELYDGVMNSIVKPVTKGAWEATKYIGRGIKTTARATYNAGAYAASTYADYLKYKEMEEKLDPTISTTRANLEEQVRVAEKELKEERDKYETFVDGKRNAAATDYLNDKKTEFAFAKARGTRRQKVKASAKVVGAYARKAFAKTVEYIPPRAKVAWQKIFPKATYKTNITDAEKAPYDADARAKTPGFFGKYIFGPIANAKRYQEINSVAEKLNAAGLEVTPLQIYALYKGYPEKFTDFKKPKDKKKPLFEGPIYNPFTGAPIKTKVKEKVKDPATGIETEVEVEKDVQVGFEKMEDWMNYVLTIARIELSKEEMRQKAEQIRNNPWFGMNPGFGFPPGFNPGYGFAGPGAGYNPGTGPRNP